MIVWVLKQSNVEEGDEPLTFRMSAGHVRTVGRATRADFILDAPLVSRLHCRLTAGAAELEVVDLESTNGTFVNGERIERAVLKTGDRLGVGRVELAITRGTAEPADS